MVTLLAIVNFIAANYVMIIAAVLAVLAALVALLSAVIKIALMIPGDQPEKFLQGLVDGLQKAVDFLTKFSAKKD